MSQDDYKAAEGMTLRCNAESVEAIGLTEVMLETLPWTTPAYQHATTQKRRTALRALLADLLRLEAKGLAGYHGMSPKDFPSKLLGFGYDVFIALRDAMDSAGFLTVEPGRARWNSFDNIETGERGDITQHGGRQARFRLTPKALEEVRAAGVTLDAWSAHWSPPAPLQLVTSSLVPAAPLIELRAAKERRGGTKRAGQNVTFDVASPLLQPILEDLQDHNGFMRELGVTGVDFIGLRRIFNDGNVPGFSWDKGGRFYSLRGAGMGKPYEALSGDERRSRIQIGGEPVGEADMGSSQLRLLYALLDQPLPAGLEADLYTLPGAHREAVKAVVTQALGKGAANAKRWGADARREYRRDHGGRTLQADHPFADALAATLAGHPILERLGGPGMPAALDLQFTEAEVIRRAMARLRSDGIGSLPVHDSLVVPRMHLQAAEVALQSAFQLQVEKMIGRPTEQRASVKLKAA